LAKNRVREEADALSLPVPSTTKSGDPLVLGSLPCVAVVDYGKWTAGSASVDCDGSYLFNVVGVDGGGNHAIAVGDIVYLQNDGTLSANTGGKRFGYALAAVNSGATTKIEVKVGY
jgi:predicted RecA/RadA family phage recombinase